ncbi:MAG TPA: bifunctional nicotinamidase/pyrazinamidase [Ginsengibacter sp.]|nr:bifunctional nicotinamidase/pyrazinamidase [Ginsengibacter sp.]
MKALVMIDIQNDFMPWGSLPVPDGDAIIPVINKLQENFELVIATLDWHPANHKSFASNHAGKKPLDIIDLSGLQQTLWPDHCIQGSQGADFPDSLNVNKATAIFRKGTDPELDSYSDFYDNARRKSTGVAGYLREKNVNEVYLTGLAGDICVYATAMDSISEKFITYIIEDATRPLNRVDFEEAMMHFTQTGGKIIQSAELISSH